MGFTRPRDGRNGLTRYQALYDDVRGHRRSAGTFATEKAADRAWQRAEARMAEGRMGDPRAGGSGSVPMSSRNGCPTIRWKLAPGRPTATARTAEAGSSAAE